jgi:DNA-binding NtrC family response regulator
MKSNGQILVVEDDKAMREMCEQLLARAGYDVETVGDGEAALATLRAGLNPQIALVDLRLPKLDGMAVLAKMRETRPDIKVVIMTGFATVKNAVNSMKLGAVDYIVKPFEKDILLKIIAQQVRVRDLETRVEHLQSELWGKYCTENIVGNAKSMEAVFDRIVAASGSSASVLILGESGTGKELVARAIHYTGKFKSGPFVAVNCAALPESLIESELFGHTKGAFTGAAGESMGLFRTAHGGTILLDEVFEMPPDVQVKLIRAIQQRTVRPVGGMSEVPIDVRIIANTNQDPTKLLEKGGLRKDLYYRLSVINIRVPPLRDRPEDIPILIEHFKARLAKTYGFGIGPIESEAMDMLMLYPWPGNVRELENVVEQWFAMERRDSVAVADLPEELTSSSRETAVVDNGDVTLMPLQEAERALALRAMQAAGQNKSKAANLLGISRKKLYRLLGEETE